MHKLHLEVEKIRSKRTSSPWPKFLKSIVLDGFRGWSGEEVRFEFPVVVVTGENGSGKSTVLKAAATAYAHPGNNKLTYFPGIFFPDTAWETIQAATISYKISQGTNEKTYHYRKKDRRWRTSTNAKAKRDVYFQDISRTLPLDGTVGYANIAKRSAKEVSAENLDKDLTKYYSSILGRPYDEARLATSSLSSSKKVGVVKLSGIEFSQFHQGAGEDATFDLISLLQNANPTSLLIIDEVEASLHPRSQRRLMHFLLWLSRTKQIQIIVSTHSPYVVEELPEEARIFLSRGDSGIEILYGITPEYALNRMDDIDKPDLCLYTEDEEAAELVKEILRYNSIDLRRVAITHVGSCEVVKSLGRVAAKDKLPILARCILDGDQEEAPGCIVLPGSAAPERQVIVDIHSSATKELSQRLDMPEASVTDALNKTMTKQDHHDWISEAARHLNNQSEGYLWTTMCQVWLIHCLNNEERNSFTDPIESLLK